MNRVSTAGNVAKQAAQKCLDATGVRNFCSACGGLGYLQIRKLASECRGQAPRGTFGHHCKSMGRLPRSKGLEAWPEDLLSISSQQHTVDNIQQAVLQVRENTLQEASEEQEEMDTEMAPDMLVACSDVADVQQPDGVESQSD